MPSKIEWCDETLNPMPGCRRIRPGCKNCYAVRAAHRLANNPNPDIAERYRGLVTPDGKDWTGEVSLDLSVLDKAAAWQKPKRIFINSMGDLFRDEIPLADSALVIRRLLEIRQHKFVVMTKRPALMLELLLEMLGEVGGWSEWLAFRKATEHILWCVSICTQDDADEFLPLLARMPVDNRGISVEPLLEHVDLLKNLEPNWDCFELVDDPCCQRCGGDGVVEYTESPDLWGEDSPSEENHLLPCPECAEHNRWVEQIAKRSALANIICQVFVGGETGPGARLIHPDWVRSIRDQVSGTQPKINFFFKSWGEWLDAMVWDDLIVEGKLPQIEGEGGRADQVWLARDGEIWLGQHAGKFLPTPDACERERRGVELVKRIGRKRAGNELDGKTWLELWD